MFKMYFVKTETPNVYNRVDAMARILFNEDVYPRNDCLSLKQSDYYDKSKKENLPSWSEVIGFTDDYDTVTIHKPIPEMIQTAKDLFDIDLCFVDGKPNLPYNPNVTIDVELDEGKVYSSFCYWVSFGKLDMTDTLAIIDCSCDVYDRIREALWKYHFGELQECIISGDERITPELEEVMKKDFKENFNINLHVKYCNPEDYKDNTLPETSGTSIDVNNEDTQQISFVYHEQWKQYEYPVTKDTPIYKNVPDVPIDPVAKITMDYITIRFPDDKRYNVTFHNIITKNDETHPSVLCHECRNIIPYVDDEHEPFDINELLDRFNNPALCKNIRIDTNKKIKRFSKEDILPEHTLKCVLMKDNTVIYEMNPYEMW